jgi:hypothetical protein
MCPGYSEEGSDLQKRGDHRYTMVRIQKYPRGVNAVCKPPVSEEGCFYLTVTLAFNVG